MRQAGEPALAPPFPPQVPTHEAMRGAYALDSVLDGPGFNTSPLADISHYPVDNVWQWGPGGGRRYRCPLFGTVCYTGECVWGWGGGDWVGGL